MNSIHGLARNTGGWIWKGHVGGRIAPLPQIDEDNTSNPRLIEVKGRDNCIYIIYWDDTQALNLKSYMWQLVSSVSFIYRHHTLKTASEFICVLIWSQSNDLENICVHVHVYVKQSNQKNVILSPSIISYLLRIWGDILA